MPLKYEVKSEQVRFSSESKLECEMVAIALAFTSLYIGEETYRIMKGKIVVDEVDPQSAPQRLREKIKLAKFNLRIPEAITDEEIESYVAYQLRKGNSNTDDIIDRVNTITKNHRKLRKL